MATLNEIQELKQYYVQDLYIEVRAEQKLDQSFIDDSFSVPQVKPPHRAVKSGIGYTLVSAPGEQIITSNPQVTVHTSKKTFQNSADKLSKEINEVWVKNVSRQIPNAFKESVKNKLSRGESFIKVVHNESWVTGKKERYGSHVLFLIPEPMVVYASPEEDDCGWIPNIGVPNKVIICYERQPLEVTLRYPSWQNPEKKDKKEGVEWVEYWDKDTRYFEADGIPVLKGGIQPNPYGFVPFVRKYSGFGKRSPDGSLSDLIVSDIRRSRDLIREECSIRSDISSILHIFAHKPVTIRTPSGEEINADEIRKNFDMGSYSLNLLQLPEGSEIYWGEEQNAMMPSAEVFQYLRDVQGQIRERHPFMSAGFPMGASGRQQDMSEMSGMRRYDSVVESTEDEFSTAFEMGVKILDKIPGLRPDLLVKEDLKIDYQCEVKLRAEDPIESDRKATLGSRLYQTGEIDIHTNLTEYQGYTPEEADEIIENILVDRVTFQSPEIAELMGLKIAQKAGMEEELTMLRQRRMQVEKQATTLGMPMSPTEQTRAQGEVKTPMGREMIDQALAQRGQRSAPGMYTR